MLFVSALRASARPRCGRHLLGGHGRNVPESLLVTLSLLYSLAVYVLVRQRLLAARRHAREQTGGSELDPSPALTELMARFQSFLCVFGIIHVFRIANRLQARHPAPAQPRRDRCIADAGPHGRRSSSRPTGRSSSSHSSTPSSARCRAWATRSCTAGRHACGGCTPIASRAGARAWTTSLCPASTSRPRLRAQGTVATSSR